MNPSLYILTLTMSLLEGWVCYLQVMPYVHSMASLFFPLVPGVGAGKTIYVTLGPWVGAMHKGVDGCH